MVFNLNGHKVLFDDEDVMLLFNQRWRVSKGSSGIFYVYGHNRGMCRSGTVSMHQIILPPKPGFMTDHINGNGLDNRRCNLRYATRPQNSYNRGPQSGRPHKGVYKRSKEKLTKPWIAALTVNKKSIHLGYFQTKELACAAYDAAARKYHGEFAYQNNITKGEK